MEPAAPLVYTAAEVSPVKVLLTKDVPNVGRAGEIKDVSDGYARNYLFRQGFATVATDAAVKQRQVEQAAETRRTARRDQELRDLATRISNLTITIKARSGSQERLYGAVTAADVAEELSKQLERPIDRHDIRLADPIRHLGSHKVAVHLAPKLDPEVTVKVEASS